MPQFMVISNRVEDLADGRTIGPGEEFKLNAEQMQEDHNKRLIEEGRIAETADSEESRKKREEKPKS